MADLSGEDAERVAAFDRYLAAYERTPEGREHKRMLEAMRKAESQNTVGQMPGRRVLWLTLVGVFAIMAGLAGLLAWMRA